MNARSVVLSSLVLIVLARVTGAVADEFSGKAVLGPAVPIGELLLVKTGFNDEPKPLPHSPAPVGALAPADLDPPINPSEIPLHLSQAILGLKAAGLTDEAEQVGSLLREFQTKHQTRVLLTAKQAQLSVLQAEIERLQRLVGQDFATEQVLLSIKIIEAKDRKSWRLLTGEANLRPAELDKPALEFPKMIGTQPFQEGLANLQKARGAHVLTAPSMVVLSGTTGQFRSGGRRERTHVAQAGGPVEIVSETSVTATPTILNAERIRLALSVEFSEPDIVNAVVLNGTLVPGTVQRRVQSTLELKHGQTVIFGGVVSSQKEPLTESYIAVTAEIAPPPRENTAPPAPQPISSPTLK